MNEPDLSGHVHLSGDVVEVISRDGKQWAKIQIKPPIIEIEAEILRDAHLGDSLVIDAEVTIQQLKALHQEP